MRIRHGYPFARHASGCACRFGSGEDAALGARMGTAFSQMLDFLQDMLVSLAYLAPALFAIAIVAIAIALVRKSKKTHKGGETT